MPVEITVTPTINELLGSQPGEYAIGTITTQELTQEVAEQEAKELARFRKKISWKNPAVCIDGRPLEDGEESLLLGAHLAGGAETLLVAAAAVGHDLQGEALIAKAREKEYDLRAHVDTKNRDEKFVNGTGCGANDKVEPNTENFTTHQEKLVDVASAVSEYFDQAMFLATKLIAPTSDKNFLRNTVGNENVETLEGQHGEWAVAFEYEDETTVDRDAYVKATGKQVFVVDMWYLKRLANDMAEGVDATEQAAKLYHAMVAFQIATYLGLCDGSHRAIMYKPEQFAIAS